MDIDQQALDNQTERLQRSTQRAARSPMKGVRAAALAVTMGVASLSGCATIEEGAALGAGVGGAVGNLAANSTEGTLIGMAAGALAGGVISWDMQKDLEKAAEDTPITVERISDSHLQVSAPGDVLFDTDKAILSEDLKGTLAEVTEILDKGDEHLVVFEGHTDERGSYEYNHQLGMDRAESVESFVQQVASRQGLDPGETVAISRGEMDPVSEDYAENRRVDIEILTGDDARQYMEEAQSQHAGPAGPGM